MLHLNVKMDVETLVVCTQCCQGDDEDNLLLCQICESAVHRSCINRGHPSHLKSNWLCPDCNSDPTRFVNRSTKIILYNSSIDSFYYINELGLRCLCETDDIKTVLLMANENICIMVDSIFSFLTVLGGGRKDMYNLLEKIHKKKSFVWAFKDRVCSYSQKFYDIINNNKSYKVIQEKYSC